MRTSLLVVTVLAFAAAPGCGAFLMLAPCEECVDASGGPVTHDDAGGPLVDAGVPPVDAGVPPVDAGGPLVDAGGPLDDAGGPLDDAGGPLDDAGGPLDDAGPMAPACGTASAIVDTFSANTISPLWQSFQASGVEVVQENGALAVKLPTSAADDRFGGYHSSTGVSLLGDAFRVRVSPPDQAAPVEVSIGARHDAARAISMVLSQGVLTAEIQNGGVVSVPKDYDAVDDAYWRIREQGGDVYFETSPDGVAFNAFTWLPTPDFADRVELTLIAGTWGSWANQAVATFDDVNTGRPPKTFCPASTFVDDFGGTTVDRRWARGGNAGCQYTVAGGTLTISQQTGSPDCELYPYVGHVLDEEGVVVEITTPPSSDVLFAGLALWQPGAYIEYLITSTTIFAWVFETLETPVDEDRLGATWLRLRLDGGTLFFDASTDGSSWSTLGTEPIVTPLDHVQLTLWLTDDVSSLGGSVSFGGINVLP